MGQDLVLVERSVPCVTAITLNRPDKRNALNIPLLEAFCGALDEVHADPGQRVIVVTGAGTVFCAGLDMQEALDGEKSQASAELVARAIRGLMESPLVTIAAARGAAIAGGAGILLACDLAVVGEDFRTGFPEVRRGLVAGIVMTFLRRKMGEAKARELLLLGELIGAEEARAAGLVSRVVPSRDVLPEAMALANLALKGAPGAIAHTKALLDEFWTVPVRSQVGHAVDVHKEMRGTDEAKEGMTAFAEKRLPNWDPEA